jgi:hypothetical protein
MQVMANFNSLQAGKKTKNLRIDFDFNFFQFEVILISFYF